MFEVVLRKNGVSETLEKFDDYYDAVEYCDDMAEDAEPDEKYAVVDTCAGLMTA